MLSLYATAHPPPPHDQLYCHLATGGDTDQAHLPVFWHVSKICPVTFWNLTHGLHYTQCQQFQIRGYELRRSPSCTVTILGQKSIKVTFIDTFESISDMLKHDEEGAERDKRCRWRCGSWGFNAIMTEKVTSKWCTCRCIAHARDVTIFSN